MVAKGVVKQYNPYEYVSELKNDGGFWIVMSSCDNISAVSVQRVQKSIGLSVQSFFINIFLSWLMQIIIILI